MKTYSILPWYYLLLLVVLCAAILPTTEGMVIKSTIYSTSPITTSVQALKNKQKIEIKKTNSDYIVVILPEKYSSSVNISKLTTDLYKLTSYTFALYLSKNDAKMNSILKEISNLTITPSSKALTMKINRAYTTNMTTNKMYIAGPTSVTNSIQNSVDKYRTTTASK